MEYELIRLKDEVELFKSILKELEQDLSGDAKKFYQKIKSELGYTDMICLINEAIDNGLFNADDLQENTHKLCLIDKFYFELLLIERIYLSYIKN